MKDGGPAFPVNGPNGNHPGMTLRDYFAAKALQGYMAAPEVSDANSRKVAKACFRMADAMLVEKGAV